MQLGTRHGVTLHVQELGSGPPLILLHCLLGNLAGWYFSVAPALATTHRVIAFDMRGHGKSSRPLRGYGVDDMVEDLSAVVDEIAGEGQVSLAGHSYGGVVALGYALRNPGRVRALAVVESPLPPLDTGALWARYTNMPAGDPQKMLDALPAAARDAIVSGGRRARGFVEMVRFLTLESSLRGDLARAEMPDEAIAALACPLLAVYGAASVCRPHGQKLARLVRGARYVEIPGGHDLPMESPVQLMEELVSFLVPPAQPSESESESGPEAPPARSAHV